MARLLRTLLAATLLALPGGLALSQSADEAPLVAWKELVDRPSRYLGKRIRVRGQFHAPVASWSAYLTRFGTRDFAAFQLWSDEQFPWLQAEYDLPRVRLFARRGQPAAWSLDGAEPFARFEFVVVVRELFLDLPWAEIESATPLSEQISEGTNIHAARALELAAKRQWELAGGELEEALGGNLPAHVRAELERLRAEFRDQAAAAQDPRR